MGKISTYTVTDDALTDVLLGDTSAPITVRFNKDRMLGFGNPSLCNGRLTTETGVPISTADRTAQGTLYFTPYQGNRVALFDGTRWRLYTFTEKSLSLTVTSGKNYDVFLYDNAGTLTLELSAAWTNDTTRADALTTQDGIRVKSGSTTRRLVGTIRADGTNTIADSGGGVTTQVGGKRFVWNENNRVPRSLSVIDTTDSWAYATNSYRQANGAGGNKIEYVTGDAAMLVDAFVAAAPSAQGDAANNMATGIGVDSTTAASGLSQPMYNAGAPLILVAGSARYIGYPGLGYHAINWIEQGASGATTSTFYGLHGGCQSGLAGIILG